MGGTRNGDHARAMVGTSMGGTRNGDHARAMVGTSMGGTCNGDHARAPFACAPYGHACATSACAPHACTPRACPSAEYHARDTRALPWNPCRGIPALESRPCCPCHGISAMESLHATILHSRALVPSWAGGLLCAPPMCLLGKLNTTVRCSMALHVRDVSPILGQLTAALCRSLPTFGCTSPCPVSMCCGPTDFTLCSTST